MNSQSAVECGDTLKHLQIWTADRRMLILCNLQRSLILLCLGQWDTSGWYPRTGWCFSEHACHTVSPSDRGALLCSALLYFVLPLLTDIRYIVLGWTAVPWFRCRQLREWTIIFLSHSSQWRLVLPFWSASCLPEKQRALDVLVQCRRQSRRHGVATEIGEADENSIRAMTSRRRSKIDQQ
jgi:hypothetical protein